MILLPQIINIKANIACSTIRILATIQYCVIRGRTTRILIHLGSSMFNSTTPNHYIYPNVELIVNEHFSTQYLYFFYILCGKYSRKLSEG